VIMKKIKFLLIVCITLIAKSTPMPIVVNYEINDTLIYKYTESKFKCCPKVIIFDKVVIDKTILGDDSTMYVFSVTQSIDYYGGPDGIPESVTYYYDTIVYSNSLFRGYVLGYDNTNNKTLTKSYKIPEQFEDTTIVYTENLGLTMNHWYTLRGMNSYYLDLIYANIGGKIFGSRPTVDIVTNIDDNKSLSYTTIQDNNLYIYNYDETKSVYLYNMQGVNVFQYNGKNILDLSQLNHGLYNIKYTSINNSTITRKFIKE
jgi:hypothetical protein